MLGFIAWRFHIEEFSDLYRHAILFVKLIGQPEDAYRGDLCPLTSNEKYTSQRCFHDSLLRCPLDIFEDCSYICGKYDDLARRRRKFLTISDS